MMKKKTLYMNIAFILCTLSVILKRAWLQYILDNWLENEGVVTQSTEVLKNYLSLNAVLSPLIIILIVITHIMFYRWNRQNRLNRSSMVLFFILIVTSLVYSIVVIFANVFSLLFFFIVLMQKKKRAVVVYDEFMEQE